MAIFIASALLIMPTLF